MKPIYLDYQSTTPTEKSVLKKMIPFFTEIYGNPHSSNHSFGSIANEAVRPGESIPIRLIKFGNPFLFSSFI